MDYIGKAVLATLIYYDTLDWPLRLEEIYKYLINPSRISLINEGISSIEIKDIKDELDRLRRQDKIEFESGLYFLAGRKSIVQIRIDRTKEAERKWNRLLKYIVFFSLTPFLKGAFVSGSMALGNTLPQSDYDILVIGQAGRLYTTRLFLAGLTTLLGMRRTKDESVAPDKFCFNHFLAEDRLTIEHQSLFNAQTYIHLKPTLIIGQSLAENFWKANRWLSSYVYHAGQTNNLSQKKSKVNSILRLIGKSGEFILGGRLGQWVESRAKAYQQKRIRENPVTYQPGGRIVYTDHELEFHPHSFEKTVLTRYEQGLAKFGIIPPFKEKDSGLRE